MDANLIVLRAIYRRIRAPSNSGRSAATAKILIWTRKARVPRRSVVAGLRNTPVGARNSLLRPGKFPARPSREYCVQSTQKSGKIRSEIDRGRRFLRKFPAKFPATREFPRDDASDQRALKREPSAPWGAMSAAHASAGYRYPVSASAAKRLGSPSQTMRACSST
jgi:hypothetical protein